MVRWAACESGGFKSLQRSLWPSLIPRVRASSDSAHHFPDADQRRFMVGLEASRFPRIELLHMPSSQTTRDHLSTRIYALRRVAFQEPNLVGIPDEVSIAAQWLACASPLPTLYDYPRE